MARALASAPASRPMWCSSEPQQPASPAAITTSTPWRLSSADGGLRDRRRERLVGAAGEQRDPRPARALRRMHAGSVVNGPGARARREPQRGGERLQPDGGEQRRERPRQRGRHRRPAQPRRIRHHPREERAHQPVEQRPAIGLLDMRAGVIDEVHVVHARRARGHAGEARQAAVDMGDDVLGRRPVVLQHVLDQVDAPARRVALVAEQHIGRAGRGAEAAMHAGAQDLVGLRDVRIGKLAREKVVCITPPPTCGPD